MDDLEEPFENEFFGEFFLFLEGLDEVHDDLVLVEGEAVDCELGDL